MLALTAAFYAFPAWHLVLWSSLALSSAGAIAAGVVIHRPSHPMPWWVLAVTVTVFAAGDTTYNVLTTVLGQERPVPVAGRRLLHRDVPDRRCRPRAAHPAAHRWPRPGQPARRAERHDGAGPAELDLLHRSLRPRRGAHVAGTRDLDRLPARRRPPHGDPGPPADHERHQPCRRTARRRRRGAPRLRRRLRSRPTRRHVGDRELLRPRLGGLLHRLGCRGAAPVDDRSDGSRPGGRRPR